MPIAISENQNIILQRTGKPVRIEFVGPPGAGKTTNCYCFSEVLEKNGLKVCLLQDVKNYVKKMSFIGKALLVSKFLLLRGHLFILYAVSLASYKVFNFDSIYRFVRLSLFDLALGQLEKSEKADVVLLEQWMIQELWSATIFRLKSYNRISKMLSRFYFKTDAVLYFNIDVRTAASRIGGRKTNLSRFDRMEEEKRISEMTKYDSYLFDLYQRSDCANKIQYSAYALPEHNAAVFASQLNKQFLYN